MKVKSIFLSMLAIAVLASCSKEEPNPSPPGPQGEPMVVKLTIGGKPLTTKAAGAADNATDQTIDNLTLFGVNGTSGNVITKKYFGSSNLTAGAGQAKVATFETTDQTTEIYAIANIGSDLTTGATDVLNVPTLKALKNAKASLLSTGSPAQTQGNVLMSGSTTSITDGGGGNRTASITLNFIASKIILKSLTRDAASTGAYGTDFQFQAAQLNHVNTAAYYMADADSYIGAIATNSVRPAISLSWATGMASGGSGTVVADFSQSLLASVTTGNFAPGSAAVEDLGYWYVFENGEAATPTTLLIHYLWKETNAGTMTTNMYFPVTFHANHDGGLQPGQAYNVALTFKGNFLPTDNPGGGGGTGGGGTTDPDTPIKPGDVTVTVTPTAWGSTAVNKPF